MESKRCFKCGAVKELSLFYRHPRMKDGHVNKCKECNKKDVQKNYRSNIDHYREYERKRFQSQERKEQVRKFFVRYRQRYPQKTKARYKLTNALRDGKITKPSECSICGSTSKLEAHHHDYSKPLDVIWCCFQCHRSEFHNQNPSRES